MAASSTTTAPSTPSDASGRSSADVAPPTAPASPPPSAASAIRRRCPSTGSPPGPPPRVPPSSPSPSTSTHARIALVVVFDGSPTSSAPSRTPLQTRPTPMSAPRATIHAGVQANALLSRWRDASDADFFPRRAHRITLTSFFKSGMHASAEASAPKFSTMSTMKTSRLFSSATRNLARWRRVKDLPSIRVNRRSPGASLRFDPPVKDRRFRCLVCAPRCNPRWITARGEPSEDACRTPSRLDFCYPRGDRRARGRSLVVTPVLEHKKTEFRTMLLLEARRSPAEPSTRRFVRGGGARHFERRCVDRSRSMGARDVCRDD